MKRLTLAWRLSAIKPDKTAAFEQVMGRVREALMKSADPFRQRQAAGWKVMKIEKPLPDGNVAYVHVINPVVAGADYTVMHTLYDAFPDERQELYQLHREAFAANLSLAAGSIAVDLGSQAPASASLSRCTTLFSHNGQLSSASTSVRGTTLPTPAPAHGSRISGADPIVSYREDS